MKFAKLTAKRMLKESGAKRVSESAAAELAAEANRVAYRIAKRAVKLCAHAKRETVQKSDIELAK